MIVSIIWFQDWYRGATEIAGRILIGCKYCHLLLGLFIGGKLYFGSVFKNTRNFLFDEENDRNNKLPGGCLLRIVIKCRFHRKFKKRKRKLPKFFMWKAFCGCYSFSMVCVIGCIGNYINPVVYVGLWIWYFNAGSQSTPKPEFNDSPNLIISNTIHGIPALSTILTVVWGSYI